MGENIARKVQKAQKVQDVYLLKNIY